MSIVLYIRTVTPIWARLFQFWRLKLAKQFLSLFRQRCTLHLMQKVYASDVQFLFLHEVRFFAHPGRCPNPSRRMSATGTAFLMIFGGAGGEVCSWQIEGRPAVFFTSTSASAICDWNMLSFMGFLFSRRACLLYQSQLFTTASEIVW